MKLPKQKTMSTKLGGVLCLISETMFLYSVANFLMISNMYFKDSPTAQSLFHSYLFFFIFMCSCGLAGMTFAYIFIIPSKYKFAAEQSTRDNRNPIYNKVEKMETDSNDNFEKLNQKIDKLTEELKKLQGARK